ncbi:unnamed protein product [Nippostrongylus brasiliensis]|uniref:Integrase catalytic domain-containing protein n=1 Tax=Nippostrongylus brasiliensis TaxID=27835 RepID=A0A0N4YLX1_NIPBR|nr:unnamed protein product [Nippostrongylus brasiliensis]
MVEIEQIEEESKLQLTIAEASDLIFMLTTRIDEAKYAEHKMSVKLGLTVEGEHDEEIDGDEDGNDENSHSQNASQPVVHRQQENQVYSGYDVRKSCDPMWCEAILSKFPRDIIKPVLIAGKTQRNQTVDNLLGQIKEEIAAKMYVENRLDAGTRGLKTDEISNHDWVKGPQWLQNNPDTWPLKSIDCIPEVEEDYATETTLQPNIVNTVPQKSQIIKLERFSSLHKALRVISLVGKLLKRWTSKTNQGRATNIALHITEKFLSSLEITSQDVEISEKILLLQEQSDIAISELQKRFHGKKLIIDKNGIIRHESRLQNAAIPADAKSPIYVPHKSELARLLIQQVHKNHAHCGKDHTLALIRQRFWIPRISSVFNKYIKNCSTCRRFQGLPMGAPNMPSLPLDRVMVSKPFQNVGCDFMGPFLSKSLNKMYVCLYTCLTTRALHLEVVENLSAGAFLNSFIRFTSRRGIPKIMRSDCGTNFKQGERIIAAMYESDQVTGNSLMSYCATERIKWIFNPPGAPWMGGAWERLVGSVKKAFNKSIGRKRLNFSDMCTVLTRIEAILNTRPLTKPNAGDLSTIPLRPVDFLQGNLKFSLPDSDDPIDLNDPTYDPDLIQSQKQAIEALRYSENIANKFWENWKLLYLTSLRETQKVILKQPRHLNRSCPEVGEVVIIEQDLIPRGSWPYGRVAELILSADGLTRSAKVLMPNRKIIHRPLNKIYPLEIRSTPDEVNAETHSEDNTEEAIGRDGLTRTNPPREAKAKAYEFFRNMEVAVAHSKSMSIHVRCFSMFAVFPCPRSGYDRFAYKQYHLFTRGHHGACIEWLLRVVYRQRMPINN